MNHIMFWSLPLFAAFTGWFTIWLFLYIIFHPATPIRIFGISIQGIFPKQQKALAAGLGAYVGKELFDPNDIVVKIKDPEQLAVVMPDIEKHIHTFLNEKLKEKFPVISMFIGQGTLDKIREGLMEEIEVMLPEVIGKYADNLVSKIDIEKTVTEKIGAISPAQLEQMVFGAIRPQLHMVQLFGATIGLIVGLIQMAISLIPF